MKLFFFFLLPLTLLLYTHCYRKPKEVFSGRPNILFIISDDQSWAHTGFGGASSLRTPGFDRIARSGVDFTQVFCSAPACAPSRAAILTGRNFWELEEAACHFSSFPEKFQTYTDILEQHGYYLGLTGKGWGPGSLSHSHREHNPAGPSFDSIHYEKTEPGISDLNYAENFIHFLKNKPAGKPFCFWMGTYEPHRNYEKGIGKKKGIDPDSIQVPDFLPDTPEMRSDLADYYYEIQWFDLQVVRVLAYLDSIGEFRNTLILITSDNGMPFPRAKSNLYDYGSRLPLAVSWPAKVPAGRQVTDLISFTSIAPTILEAAGLNIPPEMTGKSFFPSLVSDQSGRLDPTSNQVFLGKEMHAWCQPEGKIYSMRAIRTDSFLFIRNLRPELWPAGDPDPQYTYNLEPYGDVDPGPAKYLLMELEGTNYDKYFQWAYGKRPVKELYHIPGDPCQMKNLAAQKEYLSICDSLEQMLDDYLIKTGDPRRTGRDSIFDQAPYYFSHGLESGGINILEWEKLTDEEKQLTRKKAIQKITEAAWKNWN